MFYLVDTNDNKIGDKHHETIEDARWSATNYRDITGETAYIFKTIGTDNSMLVDYVKGDKMTIKFGQHFGH